MNLITRFGRIVRKPKNEYTDRSYVKGSGQKGCDQYDRAYSTTSSVGHVPHNDHYVEDDFLVNDDDVDEPELSDTESEAEFSDDESDDDDSEADDSHEEYESDDEPEFLEGM